jgi:hypothetical protein
MRVEQMPEVRHSIASVTPFRLPAVKLHMTDANLPGLIRLPAAGQQLKPDLGADQAN